MLTGIIQEGLQDLMIQYLQLKLDFGIKDQVCTPVIWSVATAQGVRGRGGPGELARLKYTTSSMLVMSVCISIFM